MKSSFLSCAERALRQDIEGWRQTNELNIVSASHHHTCAHAYHHAQTHSTMHKRAPSCTHAHMQMNDVHKSVLLSLWMLKVCIEKEPVRSQLLYFFLLDAHTGEALLLPNSCPSHVVKKVCVCADSQNI